MCLIIKGGNYVGNKIIILANESTYFKSIIREIKNCLKIQNSMIKYRSIDYM